MILHEVIAQDRDLGEYIPIVGTLEPQAISVGMKAFGITKNTNIKEWRSKSIQQFEQDFKNYLFKYNLDLIGINHIILDFEKDYSNLAYENRRPIENCLQAVRNILPEIPVSLYGTPYPIRSERERDWLYEENTVRWLNQVSALKIPVLYRKGNSNWKDGTGTTELLLSVFNPGMSTPFISHRLFFRDEDRRKVVQNLKDVPGGIEALKEVIAECERRGVPKLYWWIADVEEAPALQETLALLGVGFDDERELGNIAEDLRELADELDEIRG